MIKVSISSLQQYLECRGMHVKFQKESNQLYVMMRFGTHEYPLFFRIYEHNALLQMVLFLPFIITAGTESDLARTLLFINKEMDLPGFGMDEDSRVVFYRLMLMSYQEEVDERLIGINLDCLERICQSFTVPIGAVAQGKLTYESLCKQLRAAKPKV